MRALLLLAACLLLPPQPAAAAKTFTQLWVFGDSSVDTGWYKVAPFSGSAKYDAFLKVQPDGKTGAQKWGIGAQTTNPGPVSVDVLAKTFGLLAIPHNQMHRNTAGTNYATSGARANTVNTPGSGFFPNAVPVATQIANYLQKFNADPEALYLVSSGGNDVSGAITAQGSCTLTAQSQVRNAADAVAAKIKMLHSDGAEHIIVVNLPESFGTMDQQTCRAAYNAEMKNKLHALIQGKIAVIANFNALRTTLEANPATFGITTLFNSNPSCPQPSASTTITSGWAIVCSPTSPATQPVNPASTEFADDQHWATGGHKVLGSYFFCLARTTWPAAFAAHPPAHQPPHSCRKF